MFAVGDSLERSRLRTGTKPRSRSASRIVRMKPGHRCGADWSHVRLRSHSNRTEGRAASGWLARNHTPLVVHSTTRIASNPPAAYSALYIDAMSTRPGPGALYDCGA